LYTLKLPALVTIQTGINNPRYVSVAGVRKAREKELRVMTPDELGISRDTLAPMVKLEKLDLPPTGKGAEILSGSPEEAAEKLAALLKSLGVF
jgi:electron transfer flavoprotein beta subunit